MFTLTLHVSPSLQSSLAWPSKPQPQPQLIRGTPHLQLLQRNQRTSGRLLQFKAQSLERNQGAQPLYKALSLAHNPGNRSRSKESSSGHIRVSMPNLGKANPGWSSAHSQPQPSHKLHRCRWSKPNRWGYRYKATLSEQPPGQAIMVRSAKPRREDFPPRSLSMHASVLPNQ